jgi:hypothetical protein
MFVRNLGPGNLGTPCSDRLPKRLPFGVRGVLKNLGKPSSDTPLAASLWGYGVYNKNYYEPTNIDPRFESCVLVALVRGHV